MKGPCVLFPIVLLGGLLASRSTAQTPKAPTAAPKKDQCSIAGTVVKLAGGEALRKARVHLQSVEDRTHSISVPTDTGGRFELKELDPGKYKLRVSRVGFVTQEYGQRKPGDPGAILTLRPGQEIKDLVFRLIPSGVIAGRILDEDGEPLPSVTVNALREVYSEGKRNLPPTPQWKPMTWVNTACLAWHLAATLSAPYTPTGIGPARAWRTI